MPGSPVTASPAYWCSPDVANLRSKNSAVARILESTKYEVRIMKIAQAMAERGVTATKQRQRQALKEYL